MRLNPFRNLPNARQVWAWGMYDLANQSFTLLVVTLFLPIYLKNVVLGGQQDEGRAALYLSWSVAAASAVVVLSSPVLGALADFSGRKKVFLTVTGAGCALLTMCLALTGSSMAAVTLALFAGANIMFMFGENFLAAFLPEISTRDTVGRVSAIGWTMGYVGALVCLPLALFLPGVMQGSPEGFRWLFFFAGAWFFVNALPTMIILRERKAPERMPPGHTMLTIGFARVAQTVRQAARFRHLAVFLVFFCVYCCGMQVIINFSGLMAEKYLVTPLRLILFVELLALVSAVGSTVSGLFQDRIGQRLTVQISLGIWIVTALLGSLLPESDAAWWHIGLVGLGIGLGLGLTGAASRALVGVLTPAHKTAEFFALWGQGYKIAGVVGPLLFGAVMHTAGQGWGMLLIASFFIVGLAGTFLVDVRAGRIAAEESEREFAQEADERDLAAAAFLSAREVEAVKRAMEAGGDRPGPGDGA